MRQLLVILVVSVAQSLANMSCLVMRPGYGLVTEDCPSHAVGCRIRAKKDHIEWYELSRLYDRNQLVCVYPEEYKSMTGCMRKPSGSIRCWCGGRENCNDPETSRDLYEAFTEGDNDAVEKISNWLKSEKDESSWKKFTTTEQPPITTTIPTTSTIKSTTSTTTTTEPKTTSKKPATTRKPKRIGIIRTSTTTTMKPSNKVNIVTIKNKSDPISTESLQLDSTFEETRKKLARDMKEEEERLKQMLADEEDEEDDSDVSSDLTEDEIAQQTESRRLDENLAEDVILRRMEEEEELRQSRQADSPEYSDLFMSPNSSSNILATTFIIFFSIYHLLF